MNDLYELAQRVGEALKSRGLMLATAESCTGGWIAEAVTMVPGSSEWFERGYVTYTYISKREMLGVDLWNQQRHEGIHPVCARVAQDDVAGGGELMLELIGRARVERREHHLRSPPGHRAVDGHRPAHVGHGRGQSPRRGRFVGLALGSLARGEPPHVEPGMTRQPRDELLADHPGRPQDTDFNLRTHTLH
mgnify:CR=1 FL=1